MDLGLEAEGEHADGLLPEEIEEEGLNLEDYLRDMGKDDDVEQSEDQSEFESVDPQENLEDLQRLIDDTQSTIQS